MEYFRLSPPLKDQVNYSSAQVCYTISAVNKGRGQKQIPFEKFVLDYKEAAKTEDEKTMDKINRFFGGLANGKK